MKLKSIAAAAAFAILAPSAFAQTYVGIGIGATHTCSTYGVGAGCGNTDATAKVLAGYAFPGTDFAVEGVHTRVGTLKASSIYGHSDLKVDTFGVGGAWRPQFGAGWGGVARAGIAYGAIKTNYPVPEVGPRWARLSASRRPWSLATQCQQRWPAKSMGRLHACKSWFQRRSVNTSPRHSAATCERRVASSQREKALDIVRYLANNQS